MKYSINKKLGKLTPKQFEAWFKSRKFDGDWEEEYKKIGGKLGTKRSRKKSAED